MKPLATITKKEDLKGLPPGRYIVSGEAAAELSRQAALSWDARLQRHVKVDDVGALPSAALKTGIDE